VASAASETFTLVKKGGTVLVLGLSDEPVDADFMTALLNELTYQFSYCGYAEFSAALQLIENGSVDVSSLISTVIPLEDVIECGVKELMNPGTENIKILVRL
jgi:threonine dehydrogenase-like Zn-dependent dehydrogenase